jgi:hypothetical protein
MKKDREQILTAHFFLSFPSIAVHYSEITIFYWRAEREALPLLAAVGH